MHRTLGIDLGTTNSVAAWMSHGSAEVILNRDGEAATPSVVALDGDGSLLVGAAALGRRAVGQDVVWAVKRLMGRQFEDPEVRRAVEHLGAGGYAVSGAADGGVLVRLGGRDYTPTQISAMILRRIKRDAEARTGERFDRAVITVPAYFHEPQIAATRDAGQLAGFHVARVLPEPTAAALAHGYTAGTDDAPTIVVYDLGGGTFDVSVLTLVTELTDNLALGGDRLLGGEDFDHLLAGHLEQELRAGHPDYEPLPGDARLLRVHAEQLKIRLSRAGSAELVLPAFGAGAVNFHTTVGREVLEKLIEPQVGATVGEVTATLRNASLLPEDIDHVLLVGGSSSVPLVRERLGAVFGAAKLRTDIDPMLCVAQGAAVQAALLGELECPHCLTTCPPEASDCAGCGARLVGRPTVDCPTCHVPADASRDTCPVCDGALPDAEPEDGVPARDAAAGPDTQNCPNCHLPVLVGSELCPACGTALPGPATPVTADGAGGGADGLRCASCDETNPAGVTACRFCDEPFPVADPQNVTAHPLGLRLKDGRMSVLVEKGTPYPFEPVLRTYTLNASTGDTLELAFYEGEFRHAERNQPFGAVHCGLPSGISGTRRLTVSVELSADRLVVVRASLEGEQFVVQHFRRSVVPPRIRARAGEVKRDLAHFVERWHRELTEAELDLHQATLGKLDRLLAGEGIQDSLDTFLDDADRQRRHQSFVRDQAADASLYRHHLAALMAPEARERLGALYDDLRRARDVADLDRAYRIAEHIRDEAAALGADLRRVVYACAFADQDRLQPRLRRDIEDAKRDLDAAHAAADDHRRRQALDRFLVLQPELDTQLDAHRVRPPRLVRPEEQRSEG
ncbi:Hsp70 family protein [Streptacidiphilus jiangxiensis]|uniref:Hsp70 protein n=1 Tax=Streptacidiphilus jiangxiensis TaxID=235985 RepID=A0A1H7RCP2_STRJI|nr:Hsp70 family protein [Streptacidiphilus jiangxiensis]SEL57902.1 Hsp70 protein [Streptacidiphilus jiangxiensis]